jgi:cysteine desulfurase/selenocysteine lyase
MLDPESIKKDFPIFNRHPGLVYLDSAATSQKPAPVIDAICSFYSERNSNIARGLYPLAEEATLEYECVRKQVAGFIGSPSQDSIVFTRNETESANLVMRGWGERNIREGDVIVTSLQEHHSNLVPWQQLAKKTKARFAVCSIDDEGKLDMSDLDRKLKGASFLALSSVSNVTGAIHDIRSICKMASQEGAVTFIDGAQSVPSMETDVKRIGCDFLAFSGHKMLAPFGSGVLYGRSDALEEMDPFLYGSQMISEVNEQDSTWNRIPARFESGTPDIASVIGLGVAIRYLEKIGMGDIASHERRLIKRALDPLSGIDGVRILGPADADSRSSLISFTMDGIHPHDIAAMLSEYGICIRSGHHCAMPLHDRLKADASARASFYIYNLPSDVDALVEGLRKISAVFRR